MRAAPTVAGARPAVSMLAVSAALVAGNALAYGFTVLAARSLTPAGFGELAALLGVLLVGVVPAAGLQTAGALALARHPGPVPGGTATGATGTGTGGTGDRRETTARRLHAATLLVAGGVGALGLAAAPLVTALLHLPDPATALWLAALLVPHTLAAGHQGILQGRGRCGRLAAVTGGFTLLKTAGAVTGLLTGGTPAAAMAGMAAGAAAGSVLTWAGCGAPRPASGGRPLVRAAVLAAGPLLGFVLLTSLDLVLARHWLAPATAGEYAVGAIIAKVAFWLPQGVGVVVLPQLADPLRRLRALPAAVAIVGCLGGTLTAAVAVLGERALPLVGGAAYGAGTGGAWIFAALGTLLAIAQLLLYSGIAAADRLAGIAVWTAVVVEIAVVAALVGAGRASVTAVAAAATGVAAVLVAVGLARHRRTAAAGR